MKTHEMVGKKFNMLTVLSLVEHKEKYGKHLLCQCECGEVKTILVGSVKGGRVKSCGCASFNKYLHDGKEKTIKDWSKEYGLTYHGMYSRIQNDASFKCLDKRSDEDDD